MRSNYVVLEVLVIKTKKMNNNSHICHQCGKGFHQKFLLTQHVDFLHNGKLNFQCSECGKAFEFRKGLNNHIKNCHEPGKHVCGVCNYTTVNKSTLKVHMNTHTKENRFMCDLCPQVFTSQSALCSHKKLHDGLGKTKCPECDKILTKKNLKIHIISRHSGQDIKRQKGLSKEIKSKAVSLAKEVGTLEASKMLNLKYATLKRWRSGYIKKKTKVEKARIIKDYRGRVKNCYTGEFKQQVAIFIRENGLEAASQAYNISDGTLRRWDKLYNNGIICKECDISFPYKTELARHMQRKHQYSEQEAVSSCDAELKKKELRLNEEIDHQLSDKIDEWTKEKKVLRFEKKHATDEDKNYLKFKTTNNETEIKHVVQKSLEPHANENEKDDNIVVNFEEEERLKSPLEETKIEIFESLESTAASSEQNFQDKLSNIYWNYYVSTSIHLCALVLVSLFWLHQQKTTEVCKGEDLERKKKFNNKTSANHHGKILQKGLFMVTCKFCGTQFKEECRLKEHQTRKHWKELEDKTGVPADKFSCTPCSRYWRVKRDLERHVRITHGPKLPTQAKHMCQYCGKNFARLQNRKRHEVKMHKDVKVKKEELPCTHCGVIYQVKGHLLRHIKNNHNESSQSDTKVNPLVCIQCGRRYVKMKQLKDHMRVHSKTYLEAKSMCNICGKEFRSNVSLKSHVDIIHNGRRDYPCDRCGKLFTRYNTLKTHRKIHDDIKQFECIFCNSSYREKRNLVNHIQKNHPNSELKLKKNM